MEKLLTHQYEFAKDSRTALLNYCQQLSIPDFVQEVKGFGRGSIRNLLVHIINTYQFWLIEFAQQKTVEYLDDETTDSVQQCEEAFQHIDQVVFDFLTHFAPKLVTLVNGEIRGKAVSATPLKLFTHVLTHEFHHKGQILSMGRHLGYIPPDTDVIR